MLSLLKRISTDGIILLILLFAFFWRLPLLNGSFWLDEAAQALESARPLNQQLQIRDDFQPPLLHLLVHFELLFSRSEWWLRLGAALIPGLITIWAVYAIGQKVANRRVGAIASILLATSSFHLYYSQELRPYAMPAMLACLSWLVLVQLFQNVGSKNKNLFFFFILSALGLYTSYLYPFLFLTQFMVVMIFYPKLRKSFLVTCFGTGLTFLPWIPSFLDQLRAGQSLRQNLPGWQEVVSFNQIKSILLIFGKFVFGVLDLQLDLVFLLITGVILLGLMVLILAVLRQKLKVQMRPLLIFATWLILPIFLAWIVSFFVPLLQPKRVLYCLPAFYLLVSWLMDLNLKHGLNSLFAKVAVALSTGLLLINIFSSINYFTLPKYQREDWRSLHTLILSKYPGKGNVATFAFPAPFAPWQWYDDGNYPTFATQELTTEAQTEIPNAKELTQFRFVLVFDYLRDLTDPKDKLLDQLDAYGYHEVDRITPNTPIGFVRIYAKSENVIGAVR